MMGYYLISSLATCFVNCGKKSAPPNLRTALARLAGAVIDGFILMGVAQYPTVEGMEEVGQID